MPRLRLLQGDGQPSPSLRRLTLEEVRAFLDALRVPELEYVVWKSESLVLAAFIDAKTGEQLGPTVGCIHEGAYQLLSVIADAAKVRLSSPLGL